MKLIEELGKRRMLTVVKTVDFGIYLGTSEERVLLPKEIRCWLRFMWTSPRDYVRL